MAKSGQRNWSNGSIWTEELAKSGLRKMAKSGQRNWTRAGQWLHLDRGMEPDNGSIWTEELDSSLTMANLDREGIWTRAGQWLHLDRGTGHEPDNG
ncbi:hypothetical protein DPEC_G00068620 [Dallia pectoralis]|uniref:Uncharacterized protein n=1 Tax=Dallia pectoralis TaxID=75939 RepID=A0ACC2H2E6_DALPE|nr:hypothetical protein DPEC_G00068620 [Dallia pectoralis]